jgi:thiamine monophosphate synthase
MCLDCEVRGVAVVSAILGSADIERAVRDFEQALGGL